MIDREEVCVLVPTYNEAETIAEVIEGYQAEGFEHIFVMDGDSSDGTPDIAREADVRVEQQSGSGKGQAVREAIELIDQPIVLLVDGDSTYRPDEADRMLEPIFSGDAEHVIGDRFANMQPGAMTRLNQAGNRMINRSFRFIHGRDLGDILSGYRAFTIDSFDRLSLSAEGFGIETEMAVECVKHDVSTAVVPITYEPRPEGSETNLRPFRDGGNIILRLYQMAKTNNPIFYFGSLGAVSVLIGVILASYVAYAWFFRGTSHEVIALAAGVALLFGIQMIMFGVLSDLIVTSNREQRRRLNTIIDRFDDSTESPEGVIDRSGYDVDRDSDGVSDADNDEELDTPEDAVDEIQEQSSAVDRSVSE